MSNWSRGDLLALIGIVATIGVAAVTPLRRLLVRVGTRLAFEAGKPMQHYRKTFLEKHGKLRNIYSNRQEDLDLALTFVALSVAGPSASGQQQDAAAIIADKDNKRLIITGDPGSGKSTLLKAYGVAAMGTRRVKEASADLRKIHKGREIPFFVPLRLLALRAQTAKRDVVWNYIIEEILISMMHLGRIEAEVFVRRLLGTGRCLVLLDGLDEVPDIRYQATREAVLKFIADEDPERPTANARVVLTCRRQNFVPLDWADFAPVQYVVNPMRDVDILRYIRNRNSDFKQRKLDPEQFFNAISGSINFDLHRTPLILVMSIGLYLDRQVESVPNSISKLYQTVIHAMLDRHSFVTESNPVNKFLADDKERFLRRFALSMAERPDAFQDFELDDLTREATEFRPLLNRVKEGEVAQFVEEIVERSGLLAPVLENQTYTFGHRSFQEYLIATQLRKGVPDGVDRLLAHSDDREWQQVIQFFAASDDVAIEPFLERLYALNPVVTVRCFANAETQGINTLAVDSLRDFTGRALNELSNMAVVESSLAAVLYACRSPREPIRTYAVECARSILVKLDAAQFAQALGGDDNVLRVLNDLVGANASPVASLVPELAASLPDDPRVVAPLWRCLHVLDPGDSTAACRKLVERLLGLAMVPVCFEALQNQPVHEPEFLPGALRARAYPFKEALPAGSNLVTLLAWAEYLDVTPEQPNRFFEAKAAGDTVFNRLERGNRLTIRIRLYWSGVAISAVVCLGSCAQVAHLAVSRSHDFLEPYGWWSLLLFGAPTLASFLVLLKWDPPIVDDELQGHWMEAVKLRRVVPEGVLDIFAAIVQPVIMTLALAPVLDRSIFWFLSLSLAFIWLGQYIFVAPLFAWGRSVTLYAPSRYVDVYTDPASAHWLRSAAP